MAKTIKEMALEKYPIPKYKSISGNVFTDDEQEEYERLKREGFEIGANDILVEIENILPNNDRCLNDYGKALVWRIQERIKELRQ